MNFGGLNLYSVESRGVANLERINLHASANVNTSKYLIGVGNLIAGVVIPQKDVLFWPGSADLIEGDWIVIYTGHGLHKTEVNPYIPGNRIYTLYWSRPQTLFHDPSSVGMLMEVGAVHASPPGPSPSAQLHFPSPSAMRGGLIGGQVKSVADEGEA